MFGFGKKKEEEPEEIEQDKTMELKKRGRPSKSMPEENKAITGLSIEVNPFGKEIWSGVVENKDKLDLVHEALVLCARKLEIRKENHAIDERLGLNGK